MEVTIKGRMLQLVEGDITDMATDAVVNAANQHLQLGSGVAGAIWRKGGPAIQEACDEIGYCAVGGAVITGAGRLKAGFVIHAVGPHGTDKGADEKLVSATKASLALADKHALTSIAFPAISTGVFGFPLDRCAQLMLETAISHLGAGAGSLKRVVFCLYGQQAFDVFAAELERQMASG